MTREDITVKVLVARIAQPQDARETVYERIRHWTKKGLLKPISVSEVTDTGTGHWLGYTEVSVYTAAILNKLADQGWSHGRLREFVTSLGDHLRHDNQADLWERAIRGVKGIFIEVETTGKAGPLKQAPPYPNVAGGTGSSGGVIVILDLSYIFGQVSRQRA